MMSKKTRLKLAGIGLFLAMLWVRAWVEHSYPDSWVVSPVGLTTGVVSIIGVIMFISGYTSRD